MTSFVPFKLALLVFWGLWYFIAFSTNVCESFEGLRILPKTRSFASSNLRAIGKDISIYSTTQWLPRLLFFGVLCWQLLTVCLFAWAIIASVSAGSLHSEAVNAACVAGLGLWAAFMLADEVFKQYDAEHSHVLFFIAQLATLVALYVLPS